MASGHKSQLVRLHPRYCLEQGGVGSLMNGESFLRSPWVRFDKYGGDAAESADESEVRRDDYWWRGKGDGRNATNRAARGGGGLGAGERNRRVFPCSFLPVPLTPDRHVIEHQIVALYPDASGVSKVIPDAAGRSFGDASQRETWLSKVKWAVNQTRQPIRRDMFFELSYRPGLDEVIVNTGADPIRDGDRLFVRIPTSRDLQAQRDRLPYSPGLSLSDSASGAPLWATYGVAEASIDPTAGFQAQLNAYKRKYAHGLPTDVASNHAAERIERTTICTLASMATLFQKRYERDEKYREGVRELLPHFEDAIPVTTERVLPVLRNSSLFLTADGVAFHTSVLEHAHRLVANARPPRPVAVVTQAHEQGKNDLTEAKTGELFRAVLE